MDRNTHSHGSGENEENQTGAEGLAVPGRECSAAAQTCRTAMSTGIPPPLYESCENESERPDVTNPEPCACVQTPVPSYADVSRQPKAESAASSDTSKLLPSYSSIMKKSPNDCMVSYPPQRAPPTYNEVPGVYVIPSSRHIERYYALPPIAEPWRAHPQPALCPRCDVLILTVTRTHTSLATHVAALGLCLFGCWPCCLLPYCLNVCRNTYHLCPICRGYLGAYTPW